jgi:hypothetical protein
MQKNLKFKKLLVAGIISAMPFVALANEADNSEAAVIKADATMTKAALEAKKDERKDNIRKQLNDTIELCSALINKIQNISKRVYEREAIVIGQGNLSLESKEKMDLLKKKLDENLASANDKIENSLPKLAEALVNATKPAKPVKDFRKEVNKVKEEIISAHKLVIEMIDLVKKETIKSETEEGESSDEGETATTSEQTAN